jgi:hypothetical protein
MPIYFCWHEAPVRPLTSQEQITWAAMRRQMYVIADALAGAGTKQFPGKFN